MGRTWSIGGKRETLFALHVNESMVTVFQE